VKLAWGVSTIDPDYGDNILGIEWNEVKQIESKESFIIETPAGDRVAGTVQIDSADSERVFREVLLNSRERFFYGF